MMRLQIKPIFWDLVLNMSDEELKELIKYFEILMEIEKQ